MVKTSLQQELPTEGKKREIFRLLLLINMGCCYSCPQEHFLTNETVTAFILIIILLHFTRELIGKSMYTYAYSLSFRLRLYIRNCARLVGISSFSGSERGGNRMVIARRAERGS